MQHTRHVHKHKLITHIEVQHRFNALCAVMYVMHIRNPQNHVPFLRVSPNLRFLSPQIPEINYCISVSVCVCVRVNRYLHALVFAN